MYGFRQKIHILRAILKEYAIYFRYFDYAQCYARGKHIVIMFKNDEIKPSTFSIFNIFKRKKQSRYDFLKRKLPKRELDKVIARYRTKLFNEIKKYNKKHNYCRGIPIRELNVKFF